MTDSRHDGYDQLLEEFGRQLKSGEQNVRRRRRRRLRATGGVLVLAFTGTVALSLIGSGDGSRLEVLAQARAALAPAGEIVHLVTSTHFESRGGSAPAVGPTSKAEQWSSTSPLRWRVAFIVPTPTTTPGGKPVGKLDGLVTGPMQFSYSGGTFEFYAQRPNTLEVRTGLSDESPRATPSGPLGVEPVARVRKMLEQGQLRVAGKGTVDGKPVVRLVGDEPRGTNAPWPVEYDVNPVTYAPVRVAIEAAPARRRAGAGVQVSVLQVDTYQLIPLNSSTASLLAIKPAGKTTVIRHHAAA